MACKTLSGDNINCPGLNRLFGTFMDLAPEESAQISPQRLNAVIEHDS